MSGMIGRMWEKLQPWRAMRGRVRSDAADLIASHGPLAYDVAHRIAIAELRGQTIDPMLPRGHWQRVRREVKRIVGRL